MSKRAPATENQPPAPLPPAPLSIEQRIRGRKTTTVVRMFDDTPLIIAFKHIKPSWRNYIEYVDIAARNGDKDMDRYSKAWQALGARDRKAATPEQLCEMVQIKPGDLIGAVCSTMWEVKAAESSMVSAIAHPVVLAKTAQQAGKPMGQRDRELFFRVTGSLPDKKGTSVVINNTPQAVGVAAAQGALPTGRGFHELPDMDESVIDMGKNFAPARFLTASPARVLDGDDSSEDEDDGGEADV